MLHFVLIDFVDNLFFYNFLNIYKNKFPNRFIVNFNIEYIEGNFPHSFFTQYNYLRLNNYQVIDETKILKLLYYNDLSLCIDLNNKNLKVNDIIDKYLLMILLTLNNKNYYIHCNQHYICELLYSQHLNYIYIDDSYFENLNMKNCVINNIEDKIYNFSKIQNEFNNNIKIDFSKLSQDKIYRIMINDTNNIIDNFILPEYQFNFYKEYKQYEKTLCSARTMGKESLLNSFIESL